MSFRYFKQLNDQRSDEYLGNIWGWKNSFYGLGIILFFLSLYLFRVYTNPNTNPTKINTEILGGPSESVEKKK